MSDETSWYVLVEDEHLSSGNDEFRLSRVVHVDGNVERAREKALELAKGYDPFGDFKGTRTVFRIGEDSFMTVMSSDGWRKERFRVTVGELIHTEEYFEPPAPDEEKGRRGIFRRSS
ncbi:hypothetical protein ABZT04_14455 [Streptomyces sp. NPDC005492]|uniref:hypothetical protein n=1 Tax=Streptomyces sp. NPDC005492 TaxID=3156883 RepID=UPI00339F06DF